MSKYSFCNQVDIFGKICMHKLYNGNNIDILKTFSDDYIDLTITSPPYSDLRDYKGYFFDFEGVCRELFRITKDGGVVVWVVGDATINGSETGDSFRQALYFKETGFNLHDTMIYEKSGCRFPETNRYYPIFEYMFVFSKGKPKTVNLIKDRKNRYTGSKLARKSAIRTKDGKLVENSAYRLDRNRTIKDYGVRYNIWRYSVGASNHSRDKEAMQHPATFPEKLVHDHIISWSNEGDLILDPMAGSGTTNIVAQELNRNSIAIETSSEYCEIIRTRFKKRFDIDLSISS